MNHKHQGCLVMLLPTRCYSPSSTELQVSRMALHLPQWSACHLVSPWVERTVATGYHLQFKVWPTHLQGVVYTVGGNSIEGTNKKIVEQRSDTSCYRFGHEQRQVQKLFRCSEERGRTLSYSRSLSAKQIPKHL